MQILTRVRADKPFFSISKRVSCPKLFCPRKELMEFYILYIMHNVKDMHVLIYLAYLVCLGRDVTWLHASYIHGFRSFFKPSDKQFLILGILASQIFLRSDGFVRIRRRLSLCTRKVPMYCWYRVLDCREAQCTADRRQISRSAVLWWSNKNWQVNVEIQGSICQLALYMCLQVM